MNKIIRRVVTILPAVLLQVVWLAILFSWLRPWAAVINVVLSVMALLLVLYIVTKQDEGAYKIIWLILVLTFPLPGALLYLIFGNKRTTRPLRKKLQAAQPLPAWTFDTAQLYEEFAQADKRAAQTFHTVENVTGFPLRPNRTAVYYPLGDDMFPVMLQDLEKAEKFIFLEYFILHDGVMLDTIVEILARKAAQGVDVRLLYDDLGSLTTYSNENAAKLRKKGIRCAPFNPLLFIKGTLNCRDHRKMLVIDGKVAYSGGINLADEYINRVKRFGHWKDIGFRVTGETVESYTRMFATFWNAFAYDPVPDALLTPPAPLPADEPIDGLVLSYYDSPLESYAVSNELYIDLLNEAKEYIWFYTPYLTPGDALQGAFIRAARRGVDVRIIMPGIPDKKLVYRMGRSFYPVLLQAGVKIYEYTPGFVHAKACLLDDTICTVGTVNLDYRSLFLHFENNSLFYGASLLLDLKNDFLATQAKCVERTIDSVDKGFFHWLVDGVLRLLSPLC